MKSNIGTDNSIAICAQTENPSELLQQQAENLLVFIAGGFDAKATISEIISKAIITDGVIIHPHSLICLIDTFINNEINGPEERKINFLDTLKKADDLGLYHYDTPIPDLVPNAIDIYEKHVLTILKKINHSPPEIAQPTKANEETLPTTNTVEDTNQPSNAPKKDDVYRIPVPESEENTPSSSSFSSRPGSSASDHSIYFDNNNNLTIIALTITSFIVINAIAWYVRTYHKNTLVSSTTEGNDDTKDTMLNSVFESTTLWYNLLFNISYCLFPTVMFYYTYRYYYYYKYKLNKHETLYANKK